MPNLYSSKYDPLIEKLSGLKSATHFSYAPPECEEILQYSK